jgi:hypothetical protein
VHGVTSGLPGLIRGCGVNDKKLGRGLGEMMRDGSRVARQSDKGVGDAPCPALERGQQPAAHGLGIAV